MDDDRSTAPASSSTIAKQQRRRRDAEEEGGGDPAACTGKSCQSCTAGVIADCVAVCCCPCGVVNILALAFVKLPWAVARRCIGGGRRRRRRSRRRLEEGGCGGGGGGDTGGISEKARAGDGTSENVVVETSTAIGEG